MGIALFKRPLSYNSAVEIVQSERVGQGLECVSFSHAAAGRISYIAWAG